MTVKRISLVIALSLVISASIFTLAFAQDRELEIDYPDIGGVAGPTTIATGLPEYVRYIFNFVIVFAGIILLYALIKGGSLYLTSSGNAAHMKLAKDQISSAFLGIIILLGSYIILTTINPGLVIFKEFTLDSLLRKPACDDGEDNDGDGKIDYETDGTGDRGCTSANDENEEDFVADADSVIYYEIPVGQMIKNGVWKTELVESMVNIDETGVLDKFEEFLNEEVEVGGKKFSKISDLNKYIKSLAETCNCDDLQPICTKPENFAQEVECVGDPCYENRQNIRDALAINGEKIKKLDYHRKTMEEKLRAFFDEQAKFFGRQVELKECLETGFLMTQGDYLQSVRYYEDLGITTEVVQNYIPSRGDPFTFYCTVGGTTFDVPVRPEDLPPLPVAGDVGELDLPAEITSGFEQLSCPGIVPVGTLVNRVGEEAVVSSEKLDGMIARIDWLTAEIRDMATLVSQCNQESCKGDAVSAAECNCLPNPCFTICGSNPTPACVASCPPFVGSGCTAPTPGGAPLCAIPCFQSIGSCVAKNNALPFNGSACPLYKDPDNPSIEEALENIKIYEDEILSILKDLKDSFSNAPYVLEGPGGISADLVSGINWVMGFCKNSDIENPTWAMLNCSLALSNLGPDGKPIGSCYAGDFFCCAEKGSDLPELVDQPTDAYGTPILTSQYVAATNYKGTASLVPLAGECSIDYTFEEVATPCGWVRLPDGAPNIASYRLGQNRWGKPELVSMVMAVAQRMHDAFGKNLMVGDWSGECRRAGEKGRPHVSHQKGIDVDISVGEGDGGYFSTEEKSALADALARCGIVSDIAYTGEDWQSVFSTEPAKSLRRNWKGHNGHFHVRIKE